jgi:UDP-N-acetylmuramoyl-L-alanyl-D-glutamate--2,6-diaminopimelate ligase
MANTAREITIKLSDLFANDVSITTTQAVTLSGLTLDSRQVQPGFCFVALPGAEVHIEDAIARGAVAVIVDSQYKKHDNYAVPLLALPELATQLASLAMRCYPVSQAAMTLIAVTGTNGKTSCCHFIAQVLTQLQHRCGIIGTLGHGVYPDYGDLNLTTPDIFSVYRLMHGFMAQAAAVTCIEASSHGLQQGRVAGLPFQLGIFTNLTHEHLDYHKTLTAYGQAKAQLFSWPSMQSAIINADDDFGRELISQHKHDYTIYAYTTQGADIPGVAMVKASAIKLEQQGISAELSTPWGQGQLRCSLLGKFNLSNALASIAALCYLGIDFATVLAVFSQVKEVPGRMQALLGNDAQPTVVIDFAHTPDALRQALLALRAHCTGRLFCVFGCGGGRDTAKRSQMGAIASELADHLIITDDNPRDDDPALIVSQILAGAAKGKATIAVEHQRARAIAYAIGNAKPDDMVLIAGKGHETYQQIGDQRLPFNDLQQALACLHRMKD